MLLTLKIAARPLRPERFEKGTQLKNKVAWRQSPPRILLYSHGTDVAADGTPRL
jgi:hypothetical protein